DVRDVTVPIVALLRIVGGGVAVDATRVSEHGIDLFPRRQSLRCGGALRFEDPGPRSSTDRKHRNRNRRHQNTYTTPRHQYPPSNFRFAEYGLRKTTVSIVISMYTELSSVR